MQSMSSMQSSEMNHSGGPPNMMANYGQSAMRMPPNMGSPNLPPGMGSGGGMGGMPGGMGPNSMMNNMMPGGIGPEMLQNMMMQQQMARMSESRGQYPPGMPGGMPMSSSNSVPSSGGY